jgi:ornithine cyclodeaminase/alanine dehydrogenase-like protein (mu-crystallin family)
MPPIPFIDADAIRAAVPVPALLDAVEAAYRDVSAGRDRSPLRTHVGIAGGDLLLMPGIRDGGRGSTVKLVTVMPENAARGLPTVQAVVAWFDAETGAPLAFLDGATVTAMRTGAASGVASRLLARRESATLGLIGAGGQAAWQLRAVAAALPIRRVVVHARTPAARETFAERMAAETGLEVVAVRDPREAVAGVDVVCCATTSSEPVFDPRWLAPGTHVNGIGAFRLGMVEMPPNLFARAAVVAVDSRQAALAEAGDVVAALQAGLVTEDDLVEIGSVSRTWSATRDPEAVTAFKSVGLAIQDVAAAELVISSVLGDGAGAIVPG